MDDYSQNAVSERLGYIKDGLCCVHDQASGMREAAVNNRFEHRNAQINYKQAASWVFEGALAHGATVGEKERVVLFGEEHGVGSLECAAIEVLYDGDDLDAVVGNCLGEDGLMAEISDE
jgi:hypothetical protein